MSERERREVDVFDLEKILGIWEETAQDLEAALLREYKDQPPSPALQRRHKRDLEVAKLSLSMIPAFRFTYNIEKYER